MAENVLFDALLRPWIGDDRPFLHLPDGRITAYREAMATTARVGEALRAAGVGPGDRVAVQVEKSPEALYLYFACVAIGAAYLPLNTAYTPAELSYFVSDAEPRLIVCDPSVEGALAPIAREAGAHLTTLDAGGDGPLLRGASIDIGGVEVTPRGADDLAAILYTSGTTGRSKGAMLSHENLLSNARTLADLWRFSAADTLLHALPIYHTHGLFVATNVTLVAGGALRFLPKFDIDAVVAALPASTAMMGVPTFYTRMLSDPRIGRELTAGMRLFISGSAPLLAATHQQFEERTGHRILERYGMTETNMITSNPHDGDRRAGTVGKALQGVTVRIADPETGAVLNSGQVGVIELTGPNVFGGYWRMPEKTRQEFRDDGYFITGDLGLIDDDGYVTIVGRAKDLIITGGFNVYPKEIEGAIDAVAGVHESAVIGVPHPDFGEAVVAVVVLESGPEVGPGAEPPANLIAEHLTANLAKFKQPKRVIFVDQLPRNTMGKVQKNVLRETYSDLF